MAETDPPEILLPPPATPGAICPWCSAPLAGPDDVGCGACGATLQGDAATEIPGVTALDALHMRQAAAPRKRRRSIAAFFVRADDEIQAPSEAELPALAMPDEDVRREMLRLQMEAELADLTARATALAAERDIPQPAEEDAAREVAGGREAAGGPGEDVRP